jgi:hypothetical protein
MQFSHIAQPDFSLPLPPEKHRKTMLNHCKSLIFSKLRVGGVRLQIPGDKNGLRVVSVTPYFINTNKASAIGPSGLSVDAFLCRFASLRGTKQSRPSTFSWIASSFLLAMTRSAYGGEALKS